MIAYVRRYGPEVSGEDVPKLLGVAKLSDVPNNPLVYAAKAKALADALEANPFNRTAVTA